MRPIETDNTTEGQVGLQSDDGKTNTWDGSKPITFATPYKHDQTWDPSSPLVFADRSTSTGCRAFSTGSIANHPPFPIPNASAVGPPRPAYKPSRLRSGTRQTRKSLNPMDQISRIAEAMQMEARHKAPDASSMVSAVKTATPVQGSRSLMAAKTTVVIPKAAAQPKPAAALKSPSTLKTKAVVPVQQSKSHISARRATVIPKTAARPKAAVNINNKVTEPGEKTEVVSTKTDAGSEASRTAIVVHTFPPQPTSISKTLTQGGNLSVRSSETVKVHGNHARARRARRNTLSGTIAKATRLLDAQLRLEQADEPYLNDEVSVEELDAEDRANVRSDYSQWSLLFNIRKQKLSATRGKIRNFAESYEHLYVNRGSTGPLNKFHASARKRSTYLHDLVKSWNFRTVDTERSLHMVRAQRLRNIIMLSRQPGGDPSEFPTVPTAPAWHWYYNALSTLRLEVLHFAAHVERASTSSSRILAGQPKTTPWATLKPEWVSANGVWSTKPVLQDPRAQQLCTAMNIAFDHSWFCIFQFARSFGLARCLEISHLALEPVVLQAKFISLYPFFRFRVLSTSFARELAGEHPDLHKRLNMHPVLLSCRDSIACLEVMDLICRRINNEDKRGVLDQRWSRKSLRKALDDILQDVRDTDERKYGLRLQENLLSSPSEAVEHIHGHDANVSQAEGPPESSDEASKMPSSPVAAPNPCADSNEQASPLCEDGKQTFLNPLGGASSGEPSPQTLELEATVELIGPDNEPPTSIATTEDEVYSPLSYQIPESALRKAMLTSATSADHYWSHDLYRGPNNEQVTVHYCRSKDTGEKVAQAFLGKTVVGFDIEWKPHTFTTAAGGFKENVSLIQMACEDRIALFHIALFRETSADNVLPPTLRTILESTDTLKCGVAIRGDATRIETHLGLKVRALFELSHLHKLVTFSETQPERVNKRLVSLQIQAQEHLQLPLYKGSVRTSDWSKALDYQQCMYAAADAYAGLRIFDALEAKRFALNPRPPRPAFVELDIPIQLAKPLSLSTDDSESASESLESSESDETDELVDERDETDEPVEECDEEIGQVEEDLELKSEEEDGEEADSDISSDYEYEVAEGQDGNPISPMEQTPSGNDPPTFVGHIRTEGDAAAVAADDATRTQTASELALAKADAWVDVTKANLRATGRTDKASRAALRAYFFWHHQTLEPLEAAHLLRDPPLKLTTVSTYILDSILLERLDYDKRRAKEVLEHVPWALRRRYDSIARKL